MFAICCYVTPATAARHQLSINEMTSKCIPTCSINPRDCISTPLQSSTACCPEGEPLLTHDWLPRWFSLEIVDMSQAQALPLPLAPCRGIFSPTTSQSPPFISRRSNEAIKPKHRVVKTKVTRCYADVGGAAAVLYLSDSLSLSGELLTRRLAKFSDLFCGMFLQQFAKRAQIFFAANNGLTGLVGVWKNETKQL